MNSGVARMTVLAMAAWLLLLACDTHRPQLRDAGRDDGAGARLSDAPRTNPDGGGSSLEGGAADAAPPTDAAQADAGPDAGPERPTRDWLEDQPPSPPITRTIASVFDRHRGHPKLSAGAISSWSMTADQLACFDVANAKPYDAARRLVGEARAINPDFAFLRYMASQEYQGWPETAGSTGAGIPFATTGPVTAGTSVFAGHWVYKPRTTLTAAIDASHLSVTVAAASALSPGQYAVIFDGHRQ